MDNCYILSDHKEPLEWDQSLNKCKLLGGNLVSILQKRENDFIAAKLETNGEVYWIGLHSEGVERNLVWVDGSPLHFLSFEDDNTISDQEICVSFNTEDGTWKREHCYEKMPYICKKVLGIATIKPIISTTPSPGFCRSGWSEFANKCYRIYKEQKSWEDAHNTCNAAGGDLVSISDKTEQGFLIALLGEDIDPQPVWIGLRNYMNDYYRSWSDDTEVGFTNWMPQRPKAMSGTAEKCVEMSNTILKAGRWKDSSCEEKRGFICQTSKDPAPEHSKCDAKGLIDFQPYRNGCYHFLKDKLSWQKAEELCKEYKGHLVSLTNVYEQAFLITYLQYITNEVWIGYSRAIHNNFKWSDGWPTYLTNWGEDQPKDNGNDHQCVVFTSDLYWEVRDCSKENSFICKVTDEKPPEIPAVNGECPTNSNTSIQWIDTGFQNCYLIDYKSAVTWGEASEKCQNLGGNLTSFHTPIELDSLQAHIQESESHMWIGMEKSERGTYDWVDGTPDDFDRWDEGEPSPQEDEKCVELYAHNMKFNNAKCYSRRGYICATNKIPVKEQSTVFHNDVKTTTMSVPPGNCPDEWIQFESEIDKIKKCYKITGMNETERKNWTEAFKECENMGPGHQLLTINSENEQMFLTSQLYRLQTPAWIGLQFNSTSDFHWIDNSSTTYSNWDPSIHDSVAEPCIEMMEHTVRAGKWRERNCSVQQSAICQRLPDPTLVNPVKPKVPECREGYINYNTSCYKIMQSLENRVTWAKAEENCKQDGGHLTSINSPYEEAFLYTQIDALSATSDGLSVKGYWIGLKDMDDKHILQWIDGWPVYFSDWSAGEPKTSKGHRCVFLDAKLKKWTTYNCESQYGYICKISSEKPPSVPKINKGVCPSLASSWINVGDQYCYDVHMQNATWGDAYVTCNQYGASLASFHSEHEVNLLASYMKKALDGLWIGLVKKFDGGFEWKDDSPVDYVNWADNYPNAGERELCVKVVSTTLQWKNQGCSENLAFICQIQKIAETTTESGSGSRIASIIVGVTLATITMVSIMLFLYKHYIVKGKDDMSRLARYSLSHSHSQEG